MSVPTVSSFQDSCVDSASQSFNLIFSRHCLFRQSYCLLSSLLRFTTFFVPLTVTVAHYARLLDAVRIFLKQLDLCLAMELPSGFKSFSEPICFSELGARPRACWSFTACSATTSHERIEAFFYESSIHDPISFYPLSFFIYGDFNFSNMCQIEMCLLVFVRSSSPTVVNVQKLSRRS